jgi:hypothetical protein
MPSLPSASVFVSLKQLFLGLQEDALDVVHRTDAKFVAL